MESTGTPASEKDVLISRFSALGDVAMTLAPIYDACMSHPDRRFILLTRKHPASLFINPPGNLVVHAINTDDYRGIKGIYRLYRELRSNYDIGVYADLHDVLRTKLLRIFFRGAGVKTVKVDKGRSERRRLTRAKRKHLVALKPMGIRYAETLAAAGVGGKDLFKGVFGDGKPDPKVFERASEPKGAGEYWIGIAPFARHEGKIYPPEQMEKVITGLMEKSGVKLFIFGFGAEESRQIEEWREKAIGGSEEKGSRIVNMASAAIGLASEIALIAHCDVMLTMDSANMHLGVLAGTRVVSIWGATHPYCGFRPRGVADSDIIQLDMVCRPCSVFGQKKCRRGDYHCMRGIMPKRVIETVMRG